MLVLLLAEDDHEPNLPDPRESNAPPPPSASSPSNAASGFGGASFPSGLELHEDAKIEFLLADELRAAGGAGGAEAEGASSLVRGGVIGLGGDPGGDARAWCLVGERMGGTSVENEMWSVMLMLAMAVLASRKARGKGRGGKSTLAAPLVRCLN